MTVALTPSATVSLTSTVIPLMMVAAGLYLVLKVLSWRAYTLPGVPSPKMTFWFGHLPDMIKQRDRLHDWFTELVNKYDGKTFCFAMPRELSVTVRNSRSPRAVSPPVIVISDERNLEVSLRNLRV